MRASIPLVVVLLVFVVASSVALADMAEDIVRCANEHTARDLTVDEISWLQAQYGCPKQGETYAMAYELARYGVIHAEGDVAWSGRHIAAFWQLFSRQGARDIELVRCLLASLPAPEPCRHECPPPVVKEITQRVTEQVVHDVTVKSDLTVNVNVEQYAPPSPPPCPPCPPCEPPRFGVWRTDDIQMVRFRESSPSFLDRLINPFAAVAAAYVGRPKTNVSQANTQVGGGARVRNDPTISVTARGGKGGRGGIGIGGGASASSSSSSSASASAAANAVINDP